jgi:uncharacterized protein (TIGR00255 family)
MISGMTGFARAEGALGAVRWAWELKSVNGRGLDVKVRTPPGFDALEQAVREGAAKRFSRGSLQASLAIRKDAADAGAPQLDVAFIRGLIEAGAPFVARGEVAPPSWDGLLSVRGAFLTGEAPLELSADPELRPALDASLDEAMDGLREARLAEGRTLATLLSGLLDQIVALTSGAEAQAAAAPAALRDRLLARLALLQGDVRFDAGRLEQEAALLASRADVREELDRLAAHVAQARDLIAGPAPAGRKLEFLCQELNREANTLCSKASELALTRTGLELKTAIDQFREQAANVE